MPIDEFEKEIATSLGKESAKSIFGFINSILDPPAKELGEIFRDKLRYYRLKNQINILKRAQELVGNNSVKPVNPKLFGLVLDSGGLENNAHLQEKWAALLANSVMGSEMRVDFSLSFAEILKYLSTIEAQILDAIFLDAISLHDGVDEASRSLGKARLVELGIPIHDDLEFMALADNLMRMGVAKHGRDEWHLGLTAFGYKFLRRVTPAEKIEEFSWNPV